MPFHLLFFLRYSFLSKYESASCRPNCGAYSKNSPGPKIKWFEFNVVVTFHFVICFCLALFRVWLFRSDASVMTKSKAASSSSQRGKHCQAAVVLLSFQIKIQQNFFDCANVQCTCTHTRARRHWHFHNQISCKCWCYFYLIRYIRVFERNKTMEHRASSTACVKSPSVSMQCVLMKEALVFLLLFERRGARCAHALISFRHFCSKKKNQERDFTLCVKIAFFKRKINDLALWYFVL